MDNFTLKNSFLKNHSKRKFLQYSLTRNLTQKRINKYSPPVFPFILRLSVPSGITTTTTLQDDDGQIFIIA